MDPSDSLGKLLIEIFLPLANLRKRFPDLPVRTRAQEGASHGLKKKLIRATIAGNTTWARQTAASVPGEREGTNPGPGMGWSWWRFDSWARGTCVGHPPDVG